MATKGKPQIGTRISKEMYAAMMIAIAETNERKKGMPYTVASWVEMCIAEKLQKRARGKGQRAANVPRHQLREESDG